MIFKDKLMHTLQHLEKMDFYIFCINNLAEETKIKIEECSLDSYILDDIFSTCLNADLKDLDSNVNNMLNNLEYISRMKNEAEKRFKIK